MTDQKPKTVQIALSVSLNGAVSRYFISPDAALKFAKSYGEFEEFERILKQMAKIAGYTIEKLPEQGKLL